MKRNLIIFLWIPLVLLGSCASTKTSQSQYVEAEAFASQGNFNAAASVIEEAKEVSYKEKDRVLYYLDVGMLYHYAGRYEESNEALSQAEFAMEELYTKSVSKAIGSALLNDNAKDYDGEAYEDLYVNIFKALNYIGLNDMESALVEVRRVNIKLELLQDKYDVMYREYSGSDEEQKAEVKRLINEYYNNALARYLGCVLYRTMGDYDDARIDREYFNDSFLTQPLYYPFPMVLPPDDKPRDATKVPVNVFAFSGQSPAKLASTYYVDAIGGILVFTQVEQGADDYLNEIDDMTAIPFPDLGNPIHFKLQFPRMEKRSISISEIRVVADGRTLMNLGMTEDMELIATKNFEKELPLIIGKTVTRAVVKNITKEVGQSASNQAIDDNIGGIGGLLLKVAVNVASDVAVDATENADLRVSNFFPAKAYTGEIYMEPGVYNFRVEYYSGGSLVHTHVLGDREISRDRAVLESFYLF